MRIDVTEADIAAGQQDCAAYCPVARALDRQVPRLGKWCVEYDTFSSGRLVAIGNRYPGPPIPLPDEVVKWVEGYDEGGAAAVGPLAFDLALEPVPA